MTSEEIARVCNAANHAFSQVVGDESVFIKEWSEEHPLIRSCMVRGVENFLADPLKPLRGGSANDIARERLFRAIIRALHDDPSLPRF